MQEKIINYEIHMLKKDSEDVWELWDTWDEEPTEDQLEEETTFSYCIENYEGVKVFKVERINIFQA